MLGKQQYSAEELKKIAAEASTLRLDRVGEFRSDGRPVTADVNGPCPDGTTVRYVTDWHGTPMVVTLVKRGGHWLVDLRWWLAMAELAESPEPRRGTREFAIKALLTTVLTGNRDEAKQFISPGGDVALLFRGAPAEPEPSDHLVSLALEMPLVEVGPGEFYSLPSGKVVEGTRTRPTRVFVGQFGPIELRPGKKIEVRTSWPRE
jgi:hypothetical protein